MHIDYASRFDNSSSACLVLRKLEDSIRVLYANDAALDLSSCRVIPSPITVFLSAMPAEFFTRLSDAMESPGVDGWNLFQKDSHAELSICIVPLEDGSKLLAISRDNNASETLWQMLDSSRKELQNAVAQAEEANAAKSRFLSNMSHDIRTPMNAIVGMTDIALAHSDDPERMIDCLQKVRQASGLLLSIINKVLDMSRIESGRMELHQERFLLGHLMSEIKAIIRPSAQQKSLRFQIQIENISNESFQGDETRIQQILINLLSNAVKFTPEGGSVTLAVQEQRFPWQDESTLRFTVSDTGIGMDEAFLKKLFTPFERADSAWEQKIEGTGLGMSIAKQLTEMMHGSITVDSAPGKGTTFRVALPLLPVRQENTRQVLLYMGQGILLWNRIGLCEKTEDFLAAEGLFCVTESDCTKLISAARSMEAQNNLWGLIADGSVEDPELSAQFLAIKQQFGQDFPILLLTSEDTAAACPGADALLHWPLFRSDTLRYLPALSRKHDSISTMASTESPLRDFSQKKLLVVEDNELNLEIIEEFLSETGAKIDTASNGKEAVDRFAQSGIHEYCLILMDIQMPVMDGYEATRRIRAMQRPDAATIGIVAMSANAFAEDVRKSKQCGMNDHLSKPLDTQKLFDVLSQWL